MDNKVHSIMFLAVLNLPNLQIHLSLAVQLLICLLRPVINKNLQRSEIWHL